MDDDEDKYNRYASLPIPTYEEAISSRPTSSQNYRGAEEISDDAERQGLLAEDGAGTHRHPTVESARSSEDSDLRLPEVTREGDDARRQIEELDYLDPSADDSPRRRGLYHRARLRTKWSQYLPNLSATFSSLRLPSFRSLYSPVSTSDEPATVTETPPSSRSTWLTRMSSRIYVPEQYRLSAPTFARLCGLFTIVAVVYVLFALNMLPGGNRRMGAHFNPELVRQFVQENVDADNIASYLHHITSFDHVAGTEGNYFLAKWMEEKWVEDGGFDEVALLNYYVYLNYPTLDGRSVSMTRPGQGGEWRALLEEDPVDPSKQQTLAWHGHSKSGEAKGHLIYANGGSREDFRWLQDNGVRTEGAIALVRYYSTQGDRALKIKAAEQAGCAGVLIFSAPIDDGVEKGTVWPDGPWRPADSLQRGAVSLMSWVVGDPLTPGWASTKDAKRIDKNATPGLPRIPSLPLAWRDAEVLVEALKGQGVKVPDDWIGGSIDGNWFSGNASNDAPIVELKNNNDENEKQQIWNLHGMIDGIEEPEKKVLIGNHRDSWCFGAVDPGSGSAVMMEVASIFTQLRTIGWRPLRTIEFASWDAEEYNLVGSTEYVEDNLDYLRENGVAYLNVDVGVYGQKFRAAASPLWRKPLFHVLGRVSDPASNSTLRQLWTDSNSELEGLGAGSDYVAFQDMAGTSSIDFGFEGEDHGYPYHSCYETFDWMRRFGDPEGFRYHRALARVWALLILEVADRPLIPFDLSHYADAIGSYIDKLEKDLKEMMSMRTSDGAPYTSRNLKQLLKPLRDATKKLKKNVKEFHKFEDVWTSNVLGAGGLESMRFRLQRRQYNDRLAHFETDLLDLPTGENDKGQHGVPGREQFKHVIFGPQAWSGYDEAFFPAVRDRIEAGDNQGAQEMVERVAGIIERAGEKLVE